LLPQLSIGIFVQSEELAGCTIELLRGDRYVLTYIKSAVEFLGFLKKHNYVDCWVFEVDEDLRSVLSCKNDRSFCIL
jgi:circadian clock protein KaiA